MNEKIIFILIFLATTGSFGYYIQNTNVASNYKDQEFSKKIFKEKKDIQLISLNKKTIENISVPKKEEKLENTKKIIKKPTPTKQNLTSKKDIDIPKKLKKEKTINDLIEESISEALSLNIEKESSNFLENIINESLDETNNRKNIDTQKIVQSRLQKVKETIQNSTPIIIKNTTSIKVDRVSQAS